MMIKEQSHPDDEQKSVKFYDCKCLIKLWLIAP